MYSTLGIYYRGKRDLAQRQKGPTTEAKETYSRGKRDLLKRQKRPTIDASMYSTLGIFIMGFRV
jgi:hypothetical protein